MSKASANMWWIIIGAVVALVVMIILMVLFTGKTQGLDQGLSSCEGKGGICVTSNTCPKLTLRGTAFDCPGEETLCCIGTPKKYDGTKDCQVSIPDRDGQRSYCG